LRDIGFALQYSVVNPDPLGSVLFAKSGSEIFLVEMDYFVGSGTMKV
jgi:hypothetical protein